MPKRLLIIGASFRRKEEPRKPVRALERFDGLLSRIVRRLEAEGKLEDVDVLILTERGAVWGHEEVPYWPPKGQVWGRFTLSEEEISNLRESVREALRDKAGQYEEVFVNVGRQYMPAIEGIEELLGCPIKYAQGKGPGPKASQMKAWLERRSL